MGPRYLGTVLCTLLLVTTVIASELSINIDVDEGGIDLTVDLDPCEGHQCPKGDVCKVIVNTRLLQLPVAHCVQNGSREEGPCHEYTVGSNVMNCRMEEQWRMVGGKQCALRGNTPSTLTQTLVHHACHSFQTGERTKFLSATFTCCPAGYKPSTSPPPTSAPSHPPIQHETVTYQQLVTYKHSTNAPDTGDHVGEEEMKDENGSMYYLPVALGLVTLAGLALVVWALLHRCRHKRSFKPPPEPVTCYVNLNSEGLEEGGEAGWEKEKDTSLLIANKHFSSSK